MDTNCYTDLDMFANLDRLVSCYLELDFLAEHSPSPDDCTGEENELYFKIIDLRDTMSEMFDFYRTESEATKDMRTLKETKERIFGKTPEIPVNVTDNTDTEDVDTDDLEFTPEQTQRLDDIHNAAYEFCKVITQNDDLPWSMYSLGEIVDVAVRLVLSDPNLDIDKVYFPAIVTDDGTGEGYVSDYEYGEADQLFE